MEESQAMEGSWIHFSSLTEAHRIVIKADGSGAMEWLKDGKVNRGTKSRDWYLKDNTLIFGKAAFNGESYEIDEYPTVTWTELIKYYDTIPEASRYIILDGHYYVEE